MRLPSEQLPSQLSRELRPLYTVFGNEPLLELEAGDRIRAKARAEGYTEREVLTVDAGFKWSQLAMAAGSQSLFASRKLLELRIPTGKPGKEGGETLQAFCRSLPSDTITLIQIGELDWRGQKAAWFEALERSGVAVEAKAVPRKALPQWIAGRLALQKQQADAETLDFIADRVEGNLLAAHQEVQKLALIFPEGAISFAQVRESVLDVARYDVFNLGEIMLEGDPLRLARVLDGLKGEGTAAPLVLWSLAEEIRVIAKVITNVNSGKPVSMAVRDARVFGQGHQAAVQNNLRRFSLPQATEALRHAAAIDRMIKGLLKGDVWNELLQLALRFARNNPGAPKTVAPRRMSPAAFAAHPALF